MSAGEKEESSGCGEDKRVSQQEGHACIPKNVSHIFQLFSFTLLDSSQFSFIFFSSNIIFQVERIVNCFYFLHLQALRNQWQMDGNAEEYCQI